MGWASSHGWGGEVFSLPLTPRLAQTLRVGLVERGWRMVLLPALSPGRPVPACASSPSESLALPASGSTLARVQRLCPQGVSLPDQCG